jgi:hypothetical protein
MDAVYIVDYGHIGNSRPFGLQWASDEVRVEKMGAIQDFANQGSGEGQNSILIISDARDLQYAKLCSCESCPV